MPVTAATPAHPSAAPGANCVIMGLVGLPYHFAHDHEWLLWW